MVVDLKARDRLNHYRRGRLAHCGPPGDLHSNLDVFLSIQRMALEPHSEANEKDADGRKKLCVHAATC